MFRADADVRAALRQTILTIRLSNLFTIEAWVVVVRSHAGHVDFAAYTIIFDSHEYSSTDPVQVEITNVQPCR